MKNLVISCVIGFVLTGCLGIPANINENAIDVNSLETTQRTWMLAKKQSIIIQNDKGNDEIYNFNNDWYVVHKDWIKQFNKNQDTLLNLLESIDKRSNSVVTNIVTTVNNDD